MKKVCYCIGLMLCVSAFAVFGESVSGTFLKREGVGTGGTNWAEWSDAANWVDGIVPGGDEAAAKLSDAAGRYLRLPSSLSLKSLSNANSDPVVLLGEGSYTFNPRASGDGAQNCYLYMPLDYSVKASDNYAGFNGGCQFCGPIGRKISGVSPRFAGKVSFRYDLYATDASENRQISAFPGSDIDLDAWATLRFIAPRSAPEISSRWVQTEGSAFLRPADGEAAHVLAVGTVVTGEGIASGTFLRRVFPDGSIELSAPCELSSDANTLTFAAFAPKTVAKLTNRIRYYNGTGPRYIAAQKYSADDDFTLVIPYLQIAFAGDANKQRYFRFLTETGLHPAKIELGYVHSSYSPQVFLEDCHLQLSQNTATDGSVLVHMDNSAYTARLCVTNNITRSFGRLKTLKGTLIKDGAGTLKMSIAENAASSAAGKIVVEEGTFAPEFVNIGTNEIASLTVKRGARFVIPEGVTLKVGVLTVEEGSILSGPGRLVATGLTDDILRSIVFENALAIDDGRSNGGFGFEVLRGTPRMAAQDGDSIMIFDDDALIRINANRTFDLLLVGGGGGGGAKGGGGGGGGGVVYTQSFNVASGVYGIGVGNGGLGAPSKKLANTSGGNSVFSGLIAYGGGAGGTYGSSATDDPNYRAAPYNGLAGGSGGGGGIVYPWSDTSKCPGGSGTPVQGNDGGKGFNYNGGNVAYQACAGGGGGGAGQSGTDAGKTDEEKPRPIGGNGGDGILCEIYGSKHYGGGGGGGNTLKMTNPEENFRGGIGGGGRGGSCDGNGKVSLGEDGIDGLGGGGGGGGNYTADSAGAAGGKGGDGIVIMRWRQPQEEETALSHEALASGGTLKRRSGYMIHTFDVGGTFRLSEPTLVDILLVGGGGGGGWRHGGGGGGGGVLVVSNVYLLAGSYDVAVGEGGSAGVSGTYNGTTGGNSVFAFGGRGNNLIAYGGGGGGCAATGPSDAGKAGGSGGGGGAPYYTWETVKIAGGSGTEGQGFDGGYGIHTLRGAWTTQGGGGGGAGAPGENATVNAAGNGGDGVFCDYSGNAVCYGGGGGGGGAKSGGHVYVSSGGLGGGGRGGGVKNAVKDGIVPGEDGVDGLGGGGGGGGGYVDFVANGGKGGCGVVIVRYRTKVIKTAIIVR